MKTERWILLLFGCFATVHTVFGYAFDDCDYDYENYQTRRRSFFHRLQRLQHPPPPPPPPPPHHHHHHHHHHPSEGFGRHRSGFGPGPFPPGPPLRSGYFQGPRTLLGNAIDLFSNGRWFGGRSFHDGYGSMNHENWNTEKWRKERYGKIRSNLHTHRKNYQTWLGTNPQKTLMDFFPKLKKYSFKDIKRCYHSQYDREDFDPFHEDLTHALEHYYKYYPENFEEGKHSIRIKNLYKSFHEISKAIVECMERPRKFRVGFTELSDLSDQEFSRLLGAETNPKELIKKYRQKLRRKGAGKDASTTPATVQKSKETVKPAAKPEVEEAAISPEKLCFPKSKNKLPAEFSWRKLNKTTPAKYQGACGSCWSFAALATIESAYLIKKKTTDRNFDLSEQDPLRCLNKNKDGCLGGSSMDVFNYILNNNGVVLEKSYPYNISEKTCNLKPKEPKMGAIDDYCARGNLFVVNGKPEVLSDEDIQRVIQEFGPVYTTIDSKDLTFKNLLDGVYENANCSTTTNHAVVIVGWDAESWHIKNSWGVRWGDDGYFRMKRGANTCGIRNFITFPIVN